MTHRCALLLACPSEHRQRALWVFRTWASRYELTLVPVERVGDVPDGHHLIIYGDPPGVAKPSLRIPCEAALTEESHDLSAARWVDHRGEPFLDLTGKAALPVLSVSSPERTVRLGMDVVSAAFLFLSGMSERNVSRLDRHGRVPHEESLVGRLGVTHRAVVDEWFGLLADAFGALVGVPLRRRDLWNGAPFAVCLTHDIDRVHHGWADAARRTFSLLGQGRMGPALGTAGKVLRRLGAGADFYWNLDELLNVDRRYGGAPTFFLMASDDHPLDADYRLSRRRWEDLVRRIRDGGGEIGLHGSYLSYRSAERLAREREAVERLTGEPVVGVRQHFLRFDPVRTWKAQDDAGFRYDASVGFIEQVGFRRGTSFPYQAYDLDADRPLPLVELPLIVMDRTLEGYLKLSPEEAWRAVEPILKTVERSGGCLVVLWHNLFIVEACYPGWRAFYERALDWARSRGGRFISGTGVRGSMDAFVTR